MNIASKQKRIWLGLLLLGAICSSIFLLYPSTSVLCPAWKIQLVDEAGNPVPNAFVRQHWQDYSVESDSHEQDTYSDENGYVSFPERTIKASRLLRFAGATLNLLSQGVHASFGASSHIAAYGDKVKGRRLEGFAYYEEGKPLPKQLEMYMVNLY